MSDITDVRYVRFGTRNLPAAIDFATRIVGLELVRQEHGSAYFRSDDRDHTLCYFEGDPGDHTLGFEVSDVSQLDCAAAELEQDGLLVRFGTQDECEQRYVHSFLTFHDHTGNKIELVWRPHASGRRYFPSRDAGITGFSHVGLCSKDPARDEQFWTKVFNARVSDWIGPSALLRLDAIHHRLALFPTNRSGVQHINHQVDSIDDIMRSWYFLQEQGVKVVFGPGRHPTSGARFLYFEGPEGMVYEYSCGVSEVDEATHRPRQFPLEPSGFCMWGSKPDIPEFKS
ncbi:MULTISPECIES: VOC family protein [Oceanospirillaceae]|uniref:VOC family protein n=1 Tax=Oceanobacter antarcticus TaxID=3133425 RepID=A0ABW8NJ94_9GAMM|tara:strand:+ start:27551 stop:28405 length:855 start_codon:yes stop_codon:yes gene_type:complete